MIKLAMIFHKQTLGWAKCIISRNVLSCLCNFVATESVCMVHLIHIKEVVLGTFWHYVKKVLLQTLFFY